MTMPSVSAPTALMGTSLRRPGQAHVRAMGVLRPGESWCLAAPTAPATRLTSARCLDGLGEGRSWTRSLLHLGRGLERESQQGSGANDGWRPGPLRLSSSRGPRRGPWPRHRARSWSSRRDRLGSAMSCWWAQAGPRATSVKLADQHRRLAGLRTVPKGTEHVAPRRRAGKPAPSPNRSRRHT